ncbi:MAG: hypothetical protein ACOCVK_00745 [bacterium]
MFRTIGLSPHANCTTAGEPTAGWLSWAEEPKIGLKGFPVGEIDVEGVPFRVTERDGAAEGVAIADPGSQRGGAVGGPSSASAAEGPGAPSPALTVDLDVQLEPRSTIRTLYLLHACDTKEPAVAGEIEFRYGDGSTARRVVLAGRDVLRWMQQRLPEPRSFFVNHGEYRNPVIAWQGRAGKYPTAVVTATGIANSRPEAEVERIVLRASPEGVRWNVLGATISDQPPFFPITDHTAGAPANWGAGALTYALVEGLAGVVDADRNFEAVTLSPRWESAGLRRVSATVRYAEGRGYVSYAYRRSEGAIELDVAASGPRRRIRVLLPSGTTVVSMSVDGTEVDYELETVEESTYACVDREGVSGEAIRLALLSQGVGR